MNPGKKWIRAESNILSPKGLGKQGNCKRWKNAAQVIMRLIGWSLIWEGKGSAKTSKWEFKSRLCIGRLQKRPLICYSKCFQSLRKNMIIFFFMVTVMFSKNRWVGHIDKILHAASILGQCKFIIYKYYHYLFVLLH